MLANLGVPARLLFSLQGICMFDLGSLYFLANPKSTRNILSACFPNPTKKFSGFISRWTKFCSCKKCILANFNY